MSTGVQGCPHGSWARPVADVTPEAGAADLALYQLDPAGRVTPLAAGRGQLARLAAQGAGVVQDMGGGDFRYAACRNVVGLSALVMVEEQGPIDFGGRPGAQGWSAADFAARFDALAAQRGWGRQARLVPGDQRPARPARARGGAPRRPRLRQRPRPACLKGRLIDPRPPPDRR